MGRLIPITNSERCLLPFSASALWEMRGWKLNPHTAIQSLHSLLTAKQVSAAWQFSSWNYPGVPLPSWQSSAMEEWAPGKEKKPQNAPCLQKMLQNSCVFSSMPYTVQSKAGWIEYPGRSSSHLPAFQPNSWNDDLTLICCGSTVKLHSRPETCSFGL